MSDLATRVVDRMYNNDPFSQWLGIERLEDGPGISRLRMTVRKEMLNGFDIAHGGITYSLADSALAFASNSHGVKAVSIETSISHTEQVKEGDVLTAIAEEVDFRNRIAVYHITVTNQDDKKVALFKGTVFRTDKDWFEEGSDNRSNTDLQRVKSQRKNNEKYIHSDLTYKIIGCAYEVYNEIGAGHKESVYQKAFANEMVSAGLGAEEQVYGSVKSKGKAIGQNYFDFLVNKHVIVEIKAGAGFSKKHFDQVLNYLKVSGLKLALLVNFGPKEVRCKRVVNFDALTEQEKAKS